MTLIPLVPDEVLLTESVPMARKPCSDNQTDDTDHVVTILEQYRSSLPFADMDLVRCEALCRELEDHRRESEHALTEWRAALTRRWESEVSGLRHYMQICHYLSEYFGSDSPHLQAIAMTQRGGAVTATDLLADLRRLEATLMLIQEPLPELPRYRARLTAVCNTIEEAINRTSYWEEQRRQTLFACRLARSAYQRFCDQTRLKLVQYLGEPVVYG